MMAGVIIEKPVKDGRRHAPRQQDPFSLRKEAFLDAQHASLLNEYGMSAPAWQNNFARNVQLGAVFNDGVGLDPTNGGYPFHTSDDPLSAVKAQHVDINSWDRANSVYGLTTGQGELRPRKRNAIVTTLTPEIYNPRRPNARSDFAGGKDAPSYANPTQIKIAMSNRDSNTNDSEALRKHYGVAHFNRAPGQSFRYE